MNKELIEALEEIQELFIHEDYFNAEIKVDELLEALQKAKEQPTKNAEEFLKSKDIPLYSYLESETRFVDGEMMETTNYKLADLLEEFANQSKTPFIDSPKQDKTIKL